MLGDDLLTSIITFHSQQAVEKCFKALIEEKNLVVPHIHSLVRLNKIIVNYFKLTIDKKLNHLPNGHTKDN